MKKFKTVGLAWPITAILFFALLISMPLAAQPASETASAVHLPAGWTIETTASEATLSVDVVDDVVRSERRSVMLSHSELASTTLVSRAVQLQVGHLYRLHGWIKAEGVRSDPTTRYPTAVPACMSMASFPFTNHSPTVGGDADWTLVETRFVATQATDRIRIHLGYNGGALGTVWFDDVKLEDVEDVEEYIPAETVRWFADAYRYDDRGWIFVHVEGEPYQRGYQFGFLVADEIAEYISKLGIQRNEHDPEAGWNDLRFMADTMLLRKFDQEYLTEMKGIADGAAHGEAEVHDRSIDLLDVVTINSVTDLLSIAWSQEGTPHALSGQSFLAAEDEMLIAAGENRCSGLAATGPATASGEVVFGQIFMWYGYPGVHWNVIADVVPTQGHRLVYQTFPGGIHSGADFYISDAGIIIGETTVRQTPYDADGTPQSNRIRKAVQYASSIDEVVEILAEKNNGMYTNDWPIADIKTGEVAVLLLGTKTKKLWRSSDQPAPFGTPGFLWANNNNRDPEVRKEYVAQPDDAPFDLIFSPWNRDIAFNRFYTEHKGTIDAIAAVDLWASSPVNRAHACDGKITTSAMARKLVFLAHYGKLTMREKFPGGRWIPDLPGAIPHLSLGYSVPSPMVLTDMLRAARSDEVPADKEEEPELDLAEVVDTYQIEDRKLWRNTMFPASLAESWLISGSAAYWHMLHDMAEAAEEAEDDEDGPGEAAEKLSGDLARTACRLRYTVSREEDMVPVAATRVYDRFGPYLIPRVKGTFALHQLRLLLGNDQFLAVMNALHDRFKGQEITTAKAIAVAEEVAGQELAAFINQWIAAPGLPQLGPDVKVAAGSDGGWDLDLTITQQGTPYHLFTSVAVTAGGTRQVWPIEVREGQTEVTLHFVDRPSEVEFNPFNDIPVAGADFYTWSNLIDDFHSTLIVYGTSRQIEANHTLARRWQTTVADAYTEILCPLAKDSEVTSSELAEHDLIVLGHPQDNSLVARMQDQLPVSFAKNLFRWRGTTYADPDDGLFLVLPNPYNPDRVLYVIAGNSALQLHQMTKQYQRGIPSWALFKGDEIVDQGYHRPPGFLIEVPAS